MTGHQRQVLQAMKAVRLLGPETFSWLAGAPRYVGDQPHRSRRLIDALSLQLYQSFYVFGRPVNRQAEGANIRSLDGRSALAHDFQNLRQEVPHTEITGAVQAILPTGYIVLRNGIRMLMPFDRTSGNPVPGDKVAARTAAHAWSTAASPGHFLVEHGSMPSSLPRLRVYWHVLPSMAEELMTHLWKSLSSRGISFKLKCIRDPAEYARRDSAVLYIVRDEWPEVAPAVLATHARRKSGMVGGVPALTRTVAKGLAIAEDPAVTQSFGMHRCAALARAIVAAYEQDVGTDAALLRACSSAFLTANIDPDRPYLNLGSPDPLAAGREGK
jgi:type III HopA1-like effector protein